MGAVEPNPGRKLEKRAARETDAEPGGKDVKNAKKENVSKRKCGQQHQISPAIQ